MNRWAPLFTVAAILTGSETPNPPKLAIPWLSKAPSMNHDADLSTWKEAVEITNFGIMMPDDKGVNRWPTVAHLAWGPDALYAAFECFDPEPGQVRGWRHKRDDFSGDQDSIGIDLDPTGKGQSFIRLAASPLGGQFDAICLDQAAPDYSYDCIWDSVGVLTPKGYVVKIRVPYSSLRRAPGDWGLRLLRVIPRERRYGIAWPPMSKDVQCDICQMAKVSGAPVHKVESPFMVIPFTSFDRSQSLERTPSAAPRDTKRLGMDLRYAGMSVTLEGTYRPDFNIVGADVDPLQVNSRFKVYYPERRPFFLEGMDLLSATGAQRQFFSRSVRDPLYGAKASGSSAWGNWTILHGKDEGGGLVMADNGAVNTEALPSRDTAAAMCFKLDEQGSGLSVVGTDKLLLGGPALSGGQSGGVYWNQHLGPEFILVGSCISSEAHLPQADGTSRANRGSALSAELDWITRNWFAYGIYQATSPNLVLLSGFTDLQGYRNMNGGFGWDERWNQGSLSQASLKLTGRNLTWWDGAQMEKALGFVGFAETAGRWSAQLSGDLSGRTWANDQVSSAPIRSLKLQLAWKRKSWAQITATAGHGRTIGLASGAPAYFRTYGLDWGGSAATIGFDVYGKQYNLERESDGLRLVRARELVASGTWQLPHYVYVKFQSFAVRYDGSEQESVDKFIKIFVGWQPNAFTGAYLGWSGQRRRDPSSDILSERMVERGVFAKIAYAIQF